MYRSLARATFNWTAKALYARTKTVTLFSIHFNLQNIEIGFIISWENVRLRDAMSANPNNWQKCCMFVQDLIVPGLNITAEVSREEAFNFQEICQMFSTSPKHSPVKRVLKTHPSPQASPAIKPMCKSWSQNSLTAPNVASKNVIKSDKPKPITSNAVAKKVASKRAGAKTSVVLENAIKDGHIFDVIATEKTKFCTRSDDRNRTEQRILGILRQHFKIFDRTLALTPFGSTTFGFGGNDSNYNIFIDARRFLLSIILIRGFD